MVVKWCVNMCLCSLPAAVQFALFSELTRKYPMKGVSLANEESDVVMAHVIYNQWVIRFVQQNMKIPNPTQRSQTSALEVTCSIPAQILNIVSHVVHLCISVAISLPPTLSLSLSLSLSLFASCTHTHTHTHQGESNGTRCSGVLEGSVCSWDSNG